MEGNTILALAMVAPFILFPAVLVWYLNFAGIYELIKQAWVRKTAGGTTK